MFSCVISTLKTWFLCLHLSFQYEKTKWLLPGRMRLCSQNTHQLYRLQPPRTEGIFANNSQRAVLKGFGQYVPLDQTVTYTFATFSVFLNHLSNSLPQALVHTNRQGGLLISYRPPPPQFFLAFFEFHTVVFGITNSITAQQNRSKSGKKSNYL